MYYKLRLEDLRPKVANKILKEIEGTAISKVEVNVKVFEKSKIGIRVPFSDKDYRNGFFLFMYEGKEAPKFLEKYIYKEGVYFYSPKLIGYEMMDYLDALTDILDEYNFTKIDDTDYEFSCNEKDEYKWKFIFSKLGKKIEDGFDGISIYDDHFWFIEGLQ